MTIRLNYKENEIVSSPSVVISGTTTLNISRGIVRVINNKNKVFPPQFFEVNNRNFKGVIHVSPDEANLLDIDVIENGFLNPLGFPQYYDSEPKVADRATLTLFFYPLVNNKPIHLCMIIGRDSKCEYDMPSYKKSRGEVANLETAIRRLKVAGRLMQAFTQEDMRAVGLSNRSFQFVEETESDQRLFGYTVKSPTPHQEIKVHVLRSPKTVQELRDPNLAQQNPKGNNTGGLFNHALDLIRDTPELYSKYESQKTPIQCAVLYLDAHYDIGQNLILTHAALGGGNDQIKLAIFGSHGLHSWPINFPAVSPCFLDETRLSTKEVANDANECGTSWECTNVTMGAFMHEIGHLLGSPHQVDGVMLRDYVWFNRTFMTREGLCLRTNSKGAVVDGNGNWPKVCHWNRLDLMRYLFHGSFAVPTDERDLSFGKVYDTLLSNKTVDDESKQAPSLYVTPLGAALVKSYSGIFLVEFVVNDLARHAIFFYPKTYGGPGRQFELTLDYKTCLSELKKHSNEVSDNFAVRVLSLAGDLYISDFKSHCSTHPENIMKSDFGLNRGTLIGYRSSILGKKTDNETIATFDLSNVYQVRVYHGLALDGIEFFYHKNEATSSGNENHHKLKKFIGTIAARSEGNRGQGSSSTSSVVGNRKHHYSDFMLNENEKITKFHIRNGAWVDGVQFELNSGRKSPFYGNANGGHLSTLEAPDDNYFIVGMYGYLASWLNGVGIIYSMNS